MPQTSANGIRLEYDTFGDQRNPPLLLIAGLDAQLISWDERFCQRIADAGFLVIRFDNRDSGLSEKLDDSPLPDIGALLCGKPASVPYLLGDMADDAAGLLTALGTAKAHIVGASMGGMIAQCLAISHPARVMSLCSVMSTTGAPGVGDAVPEVMNALLAAPAAGRQQAIEISVAGSRLIGSTGFPFDEAAARQLAARSYDRDYCPDGAVRQFAAILASPDRTERLRRVAVPTVVIHGDADPLVAVSGGQATASAVPGAKLVVVRGMGHDLPSQAWDMLTSAIIENARNTRRRPREPGLGGGVVP